MGDKWPSDPPVSTSPRLVSLSLALAALSPLIQATLSPSPFPLPLLRSLHFSLCPLPSLSSLISVLSSQREDIRQLQLPQPLSVMRPAPFGRQWLTLTGDSRKWERLAAHHADGGARALPDRRLLGGERFAHTYVAAGSLIISLFSRFIVLLRQERDRHL